MNSEAQNEITVGRRVTRMSMERELLPAEHAHLQKSWDHQQMADWVNLLAPWRVIAHCTFRWEASLDSARRVHERFMQRHLSHVSYFYALEQNPSRDGYHVHALWADCQSVFRKEVWAAWFKRYGRARIEVVRRFDQVSSYCSKYVTKESAWWNVRLQWHRKQKLNNSEFQLRDDDFGDPIPKLTDVIQSAGGSLWQTAAEGPIQITPPVQGAISIGVGGNGGSTE